jgi:PemK-like, MazF-like toxin of type II toxin-antitoxin system
VGPNYGPALADQLTTVSKLRVKNRLGRLSKIDMSAVGQAVKVQLELTGSTKSCMGRIRYGVISRRTFMHG